MPETLLRADIHVIALTETSHWTIREQDKPYLKSIVGIYCFNKNEQTHCCEITPSYELHHVENQVRLTKAGLALGEDGSGGWEELVDYYETAATDDGIIYMHCHVVDALIEKVQASGEKFRHHHQGDPLEGIADADYPDWTDKLMESVREGLLANSVM